MHPDLYDGKNGDNSNWKSILYQQLCSNNKRREIQAKRGSCASKLNKTEIAYTLAHEITGSRLDKGKLDQLQYIIDALYFVCNKSI